MIYQIAINIIPIEWITIIWSIYIYVYGMNSLTPGHSFRTVGTYEETGGFPKKEPVMRNFDFLCC